MMGVYISRMPYLPIRLAATGNSNPENETLWGQPPERTISPGTSV